MREDLILMADLIPMVDPMPMLDFTIAHMMEPIPLVNPIHTGHLSSQYSLFLHH